VTTTRRSSGRGVATTVLLVAGLLLVAGCGQSDRNPNTSGTATTTDRQITTTMSPTVGPPADDDRPAPTTDRRTLSIALEDTTRTTTSGAAGVTEGRTLETTVRIPIGQPPFPLIVFGHGLAGHPDDFTRLLESWGDAGFVVAAPAFPLTNSKVSDTGTNLGDVSNQPGDVSFVIDEMIRLSSDPTSELFGAVDADRVGIAGLSLGGITTYATTFSECCRDDRVDAAVVLAGTVSTGRDFGAFLPTDDVPLLVMHGDADGVIGYESAESAYALLVGPRYLVTLLGGGHAEPFNDASTEFAPIVDAVTVDFWNAYLGDDDTARDRLAIDGQVPELTEMRSDG
jgi:predicted dienelactone hydrolase